MKTLGLSLIIMGNLMAILESVRYKRNEILAEIEGGAISDDMDSASSEVVRDRKCPPWAGVSLILAGTIVYLAGMMK